MRRSKWASEARPGKVMSRKAQEEAVIQPGMGGERGTGFVLVSEDELP